MHRQPALLQPQVDQRSNRPRHAEDAAVQRVAEHHQAAHMATRAAADLGATEAVGRAAPGALGGKLLEGVRGGIGQGRS